MIPGMPPAAGASGPPPSGPPGGVGAAAAPSPMAGGQAQAMTQLKIGVEALQKALPGIPVGSELHNDILKAVSGIGKHMAEGGVGHGDPQAMIQQLALLSRDAKAQPGQMSALQGMMGGGAPPPPAGGPPPMAA